MANGSNIVPWDHLKNSQNPISDSSVISSDAGQLSWATLNYPNTFFVWTFRKKIQKCCHGYPMY